MLAKKKQTICDKLVDEREKKKKEKKMNEWNEKDASYIRKQKQHK